MGVLQAVDDLLDFRHVLLYLGHLQGLIQKEGFFLLLLSLAIIEDDEIRKSLLLYVKIDLRGLQVLDSIEQIQVFFSVGLHLFIEGLQLLEYSPIVGVLMCVFHPQVFILLLYFETLAILAELVSSLGF